jgi:alpha-L-rhamnosidase
MLKASDLRCEYITDPVGIDEPLPRLSWIVDSAMPGVYAQRQTAYRIIVSHSKMTVLDGLGEVWDSGKIPSSKTNQIAYNGRPLVSATEYWWRVMVWDEEDTPSEWSEPARWITGLLSPVEWQAKFIGIDTWKDEYRKRNTFGFTAGEDFWIWYPDNTDTNGEFYFRKMLSLDKNHHKGSVRVLITADEWWVLYINGKEADRSDRYIFSWARPKLVDISGYLRSDDNLIAVHTSNSYLDKPGLAAVVYVCSGGTDKIICRTDNTWKCSRQHMHGWMTPEFDDVAWSHASVCSVMGDLPWRVPHQELILPPPVYMRKNFLILKKIKYAYLFGTALGIVHFRVNGRPVAPDRFTPGWTDYRKRLHYRTYDVTELLRADKKNTIGIILADGWYAGYVGWERRRQLYGECTRALLRLHIEYEDGTSDAIVSDESWNAAYGPIKEADLLMGESYDAREEERINGWDTPEYEDNDWQGVIAESRDMSIVCAHPGPPVREMTELQTRTVTNPKPGVYIFDIGQNIAGYARLKIKGSKGTEIKIRYGEMLQSDGSLYTENLRNARATDLYILKGEGEEIWKPLFTYHGFRYIELTGCEEEPSPDVITGIAVGSTMDAAGSFDCSDSLVNKIYSNVGWSLKSNLMDIPTDCPQRDERLGWTDSHHIFRFAAYTMDVAAFYTKWLADMNDAQLGNGAYPPIAPYPSLATGPLYDGAPAWADSGILIPYLLYRYYGDVRILEKYYGNMRKYIEYLIKNSDGYIRPDYGYGDWLSVGAETPRSVIGTLYFAQVAQVMASFARILLRSDDDEMYGKLYHSIRRAFIRKFVDDEGIITGDTQTSYVLALTFGLLEGSRKEKAFLRLTRDIEKRGYHLSTGFLGIPYVLSVLTENGREDIAWRILTNSSYPSWGFMIRCGATTMWERWDSWTPEKGFNDPLMNSFNHFSLGAFAHWMYESLGGIKINLPEERQRFTVHPIFPSGLTEINAGYKSINGPVRTSWKYEEGEYVLEIYIPANNSARVILPDGMTLRTEVDRSSYEVTRLGGKVVFVIFSGQYVFKGKGPTEKI